MNAIVYHRYGDAGVLEAAEVEKPSPKDDEVLIRVRAAALNPLDMHFMHDKPFLLKLVLGFKPKMKPGVDVAGVIEAAGKNVHLLKVGDEVFGACAGGALADYVCATESRVVPKPANVSFDEAAGINVAGKTALQGLRKGKIHSGQRVLVHGASGGVGSYGLQIAKAYGAHVTAVCSTKNVPLIESLGADRVIDYATGDFTKSGETYDLILDTVGDRSLRAFRRALKPGGYYIALAAPYHGWIGFLLRLLAMPILSRLTNKKMVMIMAQRNREDLVRLGNWLASGEVKSVVDGPYKFTEDEVRKAMRRLEERRARGKLVITMQ